MKNLFNYLPLIILLCLTLLISSCGKDDSGPSFDFKNQNLQGTIDGLPYTYGEGTVELTTIDGEEELSFDLYHSSEDISEACDFFGFGDHVNVFFFIPAKVGVYQLSFDLSSFDGQTVTLYNPDGSVNNIATLGAVEILTITETQVTGRMDARMDAENSVNGNFTVEFCPEN